MVTYSKGAESPVILWITNIFNTGKLRNLLSSEAYVGNAVAEKQSIKGSRRLSQGFMLYLFAYLSAPPTFFFVCVPDWGALKNESDWLHPPIHPNLCSLLSLPVFWEKVLPFPGPVTVTGAVEHFLQREDISVPNQRGKSTAVYVGCGL